MPTDTSAFAVQGLVVVVLADYAPGHQAWGWKQLVRGPAPWMQVPGMRFAKVMGCGHAGGFSLRPSASHQGVISVLEDATSAQSFFEGKQLQAMRERSRHFWAGLLAVESARGAWDGKDWSATPAASLGPHSNSQRDGNSYPLAVITRASIRPSQALAFWRHAPASQADLESAAGCTLAIGLGEAPLLRQCTFSLWRSPAAMQGYAQGGAHRRAADAAWRENFFSESLFVRMRLLEQQGSWPLPGQPGNGPPA